MNADFNIAKMRSLITLENATVTREDGGGETLSWSGFATVWAYVEPRSPSEIFRAHDLESRRIVKMIIRARTDIPERLRVSWNDHHLRVLWVEAIDDTLFYIRLHCEEENR